jgi:hypothetical protein
VLAPQCVAHALLLPPDELVAENDGLEPVGLELDPRRGCAPRTFPTAAAGSFFDEPPPRERAQVVAARRRALSDLVRALRCRGFVDRMQMVEQGKPRRVRKRAHRTGVGQVE